jgi:hemerythrin
MTADPGGLQWGEEYALGLVEIDETHKELVGLYNRVAWSCQHATSVASIREAVRSFLLYARWHFSEEEASMLELHFPEYVVHKSDHERLLQDGTDFIESFGSALSKNDSPAIAKYFKYWLTRHMILKDQKFREFLRQNRGVCVAIWIGCLAAC